MVLLNNSLLNKKRKHNAGTSVLVLVLLSWSWKMICFWFEILERMCGTLIWILLFQVSRNNISADPFFWSFVSTSYVKMGQCTGGLATHVPQRWDIFTPTWWKFVLQTPWSPATHEGYSTRLAYRGELSRRLGSSFIILLGYTFWGFHDGGGWGLSSVLWVALWYYSRCDYQVSPFSHKLQVSWHMMLFLSFV